MPPSRRSEAETTTSAHAAPGASRAGRNLPAAIGVGVGLGALVIGSLVVRKEAFAVVLGAAIVVGVWELKRALETVHIRISALPLWIGAVSMILSAMLRGPEALTVTFGLTCVALLIWRVADGVADAPRDLAGSMFVAMYPCFLAGFAALMLAPSDGHWRIIFFVLVTVCSDIGGYAFGVTLGRHPMAPSISPRKSWEGFAGSVATCAVAGALSIHWMLDRPYWQGAVIGAVVAFGATTGDLIESLLKRDLAIKDMGALLPGHGGIMDRLDSLLICAPIVWAFLTLWVPAS
ncbi:MAG: phosphatidate cytidylyltransferase [Nostocoides sp.]